MSTNTCKLLRFAIDEAEHIRERSELRTEAERFAECVQELTNHYTVTKDIIWNPAFWKAVEIR